MSSMLQVSAQVSIIMPRFQQCHFIRRAIDSLMAQLLANWELIVIDDGSQGDTANVLGPYLADPRVHYLHMLFNQGLGHALNEGLDRARAPLVAYLPSDEVYYRSHLQQLVHALGGNWHAVLACASVRHHYNREASAQIAGHAPQLVQCMHRSITKRWMTRDEIESDDLERLLWGKLRAEGAFVDTGAINCEWVDHPAQRHKLMQEPVGGINPFRRHYRVSQPLRFHTTVGNAIVVGELAYNADRVLALGEQGHRLCGLWMPDPYWYNTVGPLPFGHVPDLPQAHWREAVQQLQPDVIYAQLNWQAVPFAHEVMRATPGIPFVWYFKEGPFICLEKGTWPQLIELFEQAHGPIFSSPEMRDWFDTVNPGLSRCRPCHVLDGDLPAKGWFDSPGSALLSNNDGEIHTVVPGRPIGLHRHTVAALAAQGIHLHFYGDFTHGQWREWIDASRALAPRHLHLHAKVDQAHWVAEFSRYDAGWLHAFQSSNGGEIRRANWDDRNYPARMATLAAAGLPMIQRRNDGAIVATQTLATQLGIGIFYDSVEQLGQQLREREPMQSLRARMRQTRHVFTFDHHAPALLDFFRGVIAGAQRCPAKPRSAA